ncbi:unnamed protein product, partial [Didymodactylos carnosus]
DFKRIFMSSDRHCSKENLKFLKTCAPVLRGFPVEKLSEFPHAIQHSNYKYFKLICKFVDVGALSIWKRLDRTRHLQQQDKEEEEENVKDSEQPSNEDHSMFTEINLSGDVDETAAKVNDINPLEADFRLSKARRSPMADITSENRSASSLSLLNEGAEKILRGEKRFPGLFDTRDRLKLIDYDSLTINAKSNSVDRNVHLQTGRAAPMITNQKRLLTPGLSDMLFTDQPALTIISNDCECILLLKSSFIRIAPDAYKEMIRRHEIPFPTENDFYKCYHSNEIWKRYAKDVYNDAFKRMNKHKERQELLPILINQQKITNISDQLEYVK